MGAELADEGHAFSKRKIKNLQSYVLLEFVDETFDTFLVGALSLGRQRHHQYGIGEYHSAKRKS
jgi:hypothetical protein